MGAPIGKGKDYATLMSNPETGDNPGYEYVKLSQGDRHENVGDHRPLPIAAAAKPRRSVMRGLRGWFSARCQVVRIATTAEDGRLQYVSTSG